jgi:hypothetical protein
MKIHYENIYQGISVMILEPLKMLAARAYSLVGTTAENLVPSNHRAFVVYGYETLFPNPVSLPHVFVVKEEESAKGKPSGHGVQSLSVIDVNMDMDVPVVMKEGYAVTLKDFTKVDIDADIYLKVDSSSDQKIKEAASAYSRNGYCWRNDRVDGHSVSGHLWPVFASAICKTMAEFNLEDIPSSPQRMADRFREEVAESLVCTPFILAACTIRAKPAPKESYDPGNCFDAQGLKKAFPDNTPSP